jgi:hypothetical protein
MKTNSKNKLVGMIPVITIIPIVMILVGLKLMGIVNISWATLGIIVGILCIPLIIVILIFAGLLVFLLFAFICKLFSK